MQKIVYILTLLQIIKDKFITSSRGPVTTYQLCSDFEFTERNCTNA